MTSTYKSVTLVKRPTDSIVLGETFKVKEESPIPSEDDLKDGEVVFCTKYISIDPGMRDWLNDDETYMPPVGVNEVMRGFAAGTILASKNDNFPKGSFATGLVGWTEYKICHADELQKAQIRPGGQLVDALSAFGKPTLTVLPSTSV